jgi:signal transduction histidine kinase
LFFASTPVRGTPWHVIAVTPEAGLLAPIGGDAQLFPWLVFGAFALASCVALFLLFRTGTQRRLLTEANAALQSRNEELRELDRLKDEFVALVSHELRTPLTSIVGYVRVLLRDRAEPLQARQRELLQVVDRNASRLVALVGDLLFTGKVDAGKLTLEPTCFELAELARQSVESALPVADETDVELIFEHGGDVELEADRARIAQLIDNLVSNAVKFTPAGGRVTVRVEAGDDDALLTVEDSGIGIPEAELERLFERFFRASTATSREIPGSGLGLSVAKTIAELHGGSLELRSREGEGTTVVVRLPRGAAATTELAA